MVVLTGTDIVVSGIFALLLLVIATVQARVLKLGLGMALFTAAVVVFCAYARYLLETDTPADAAQYYVMGIIGSEFTLGTEGIGYLTSFFSVTLNLGFLPTMVAFSIFGLLATQLVYATFLRLGGDQVRRVWRFAFLAMLMTSVCFWGAGISKDGLALLGIALFCWALTKDSKRIALMALGVAFTTFARPHMGLLMIFALGAGILIGREAKPSERFIVGLIGSFVIIVLIPLVLVYAGFDGLFSIAELNESIEQRNQYYVDTGGYLDLSQLSLPMKLVSYLFRPFPWEATSAIQVAAMAQNLVLLIGLVLVLPSLFRRKAWSRTIRDVSLLGFGSACLLLTAFSTANLGISARQKWMAVVPLFFVLFGVWRRRRRGLATQAKRRSEEEGGNLGGAADGAMQI